jgi:hypothetical protein
VTLQKQAGEPAPIRGHSGCLTDEELALTMNGDGRLEVLVCDCNEDGAVHVLDKGVDTNTKPQTPRLNGNVERSHRIDAEGSIDSLTAS